MSLYTVTDHTKHTTQTGPAPTGPTPTEALTDQPIPFDLYREVHKGLRSVLFDLTTSVGSADCTDVAAREAIADHVERVVTLLHAHHGHEDEFIRPLLLEHAPRVCAMIDEGHAETEADLIEIGLLVDKVLGAGGDEAISHGLDLYRFLALFTARYLAHMALEEGGVMTALRDAMSTDELFAVEVQLRSSVPPPLMCEFIVAMAPAMNPSERTDMLGGMRAGAPPEVFELFRAAAETALTPAQYRSVADRVGLA